MTKKMTKAEKRWHELTDGKILVAKPGKEQEFYKALESTIQIAHGSLGWDGQAEMMVDLGLDSAIGAPLKGSRKQKIKKMKDFLIQTFLGSIYEVSDWVTPEQAENRRKATKVLLDPKNE